MKKNDSWNSEFRKKRFYENQEIKNIKYWHNYAKNHKLSKNIDKTIAVLLELNESCINIDDDKAIVFIYQLDVIRKKFEADYCTISVSTTDNNSNRIVNVLDILSRNLTKNIKIGTSFYDEGKYYYDTKTDIFEPKSVLLNNSLEKFLDTYVNNCDYFKNQWFAIVNTMLSDDFYREFQYKQPMLIARPSQVHIYSKSNNFINASLTTVGFDGVIEIFDNYIKSVNRLSKDEILEKQKNIIHHLYCYQLRNKITNKEYNYIERYFKEGHAYFDDYIMVLNELDLVISNLNKNDSKVIYLKNLYKLIAKLFRGYLAEESFKNNKSLVKSHNN